ncbi:phenazine biosynthesis protein PhzF family [Massilia violaceinigra]|uniref:Phenazine biosynthesis protein PhzF family n=1 Tax=Massilia violaceinigra TaxID=2045208 RepID=A0A2D2DVU9_9BURK|nr:PhzF family phenazine biosynthesis protein [Massilia violaceinigra]ATQ79098.1 phenazine biosynthesis protein PhzF family [Massilia violaceinigra]
MAPGAPRRFKQVDVFTSVAFKGNPLAVVLDADGLSDADMQAMARWTNLSETTFVLTPRDAQADYRVRIFSPDTEFPFAGHPTLGTAHALLEAGLVPRRAGTLVQECGVGLVPIELGAAGMLAFRSPAASLVPLALQHLPLLARVLPGTTVDAECTPLIATMGIAWLVVRLASAQACLDARVDGAALQELTRLGVTGVALYGPHDAAGPADYEVRALFTKHGALVEDPVTGSANACIARVLQAQGFPDGGETGSAYSARQGASVACDGRIAVRYVDGEPWIGGRSVTVIDGTVRV